MTTLVKEDSRRKQFCYGGTSNDKLARRSTSFPWCAESSHQNSTVPAASTHHDIIFAETVTSSRAAAQIAILNIVARKATRQELRVCRSKPLLQTLEQLTKYRFAFRLAGSRN